MYTYKYPRPAITTDTIIFGYDTTENKLKILLIKRKNEPFKNKWAFPGGFVDINETLEKAASRELKEETGLSNIKLNQLYAASKINRDPRGRTISIIFWTTIKINYNIKGNDDATQAKWFNIEKTPKLSFDHEEIYKIAIKKLKFNIEKNISKNQIIKLYSKKILPTINLI